MDTLTIVSDTLAVKFRTATNVCQTCVEETGTNGYDVLIVFIICACVGVIAAYGICKYYKSKKEERDFQEKKDSTNIDGSKNNESHIKESKNSSESTDEKEYKREEERQKRVLNLMQEICTLSQDPGSSKDVKGKYNHDDATKLWSLYQEIDKYHKFIPTSSDNSDNISEQQNG